MTRQSSDLSPIKCLSGTSSGDVSGDGLTIHRTLIIKLTDALQSPGGMVADTPSNHWAAYQEREASLSHVLDSKWWPYSLLRLL